jgi:hypothetical protein
MTKKECGDDEKGSEDDEKESGDAKRGAGMTVQRKRK